MFLYQVIIYRKGNSQRTTYFAKGTNKQKIAEIHKTKFISDPIEKNSAKTGHFNFQIKEENHNDFFHSQNLKHTK